MSNELLPCPMTGEDAEEFEMFLIRHLGPSVLVGDKISLHFATQLAFAKGIAHGRRTPPTKEGQGQGGDGLTEYAKAMNRAMIEGGMVKVTYISREEMLSPPTQPPVVSMPDPVGEVVDCDFYGKPIFRWDQTPVLGDKLFTHHQLERALAKYTQTQKESK